MVDCAPLPPDPAYQQVLKGLPAVDYTRDELLYLPRNPRSWRVYGFAVAPGSLTRDNNRATADSD